MYYPMVKREVETLGKDLSEMAEEIVEEEPGPELPFRGVLPRRVKPNPEITKSLSYILARLSALYEFVSSQG